MAHRLTRVPRESRVGSIRTSDAEISPAVTKLLNGLRARGIILHAFEFRPERMSDAVKTPETPLLETCIRAVQRQRGGTLSAMSLSDAIRAAGAAGGWARHRHRPASYGDAARIQYYRRLARSAIEQPHGAEICRIAGRSASHCWLRRTSISLFSGSRSMMLIGLP